MRRDAGGDLAKALRTAARTAMCPICRCMGTTRVNQPSGTVSSELICLRCGTSLHVDVARAGTGSSPMLIVEKIANLRGVRPAGEPGEVSPGSSLSLERWLALVVVDVELLRKLVRDAVRSPKFVGRPPDWLGEFEKSSRDPIGYVGAISLIILLVLPAVVIFSYLPLWSAAIIALLAIVVMVATFRRTFAQSASTGHAHLPVIVAPEIEGHLLVAIETALSTAGVRSRTSRSRVPGIEGTVIDCEDNTFSITFRREHELSPQPVLEVHVSPVTKENFRLAQRTCRVLGQVFVEMGFHLLPIPPPMGGLVAAKR